MSWIIAHFADVGPHETPDGVPVQPGQRLNFGWRRAGTALVLFTGHATPTLAALGARPLQRVAAAPSRQRSENPAALQGTWAGTAGVADFARSGRRTPSPTTPGRCG